MKNETNAVIDDFTDEDKQESPSINLWDYKEQKEIVGIVEEVGEGNFGGKRIGLKTNDSENELIYLPELTALNTKLSKIEVGNKIKVVFNGEEKSKKSGRYYMVFDVFIK